MVCNKTSVVIMLFLLWSSTIWGQIQDGQVSAEPVESVVENAQPEAQEDTGEEEFLDLSLEDLMNVEVASAGSLTATTRKLSPATVTTITREDIKNANCRSLDELLDIYVPNLQLIRSHWEKQNMGLRGIISDRDDKYLLLVNGRAMNEKTHYGALTERDLPMLGDIDHIDIVRGPGSALYGPGAVSMVINIVTLDGETFNGTEVSGKTGIIEEYNIGEIKHGRKLDNGFSLFMYAAGGVYPGASPEDAHQVFAMDFPSTSDYPWWDPAWGTNTGPAHLPGDGTRAGEPMEIDEIAFDQGSAKGIPPMKYFVELKDENWVFWSRYTQGGKQLVYDPSILARQPLGWADYAQPLKKKYYDYRQLTNYIGRTTELTDQTDLETSVSYDLTDFRRTVSNSDRPADIHREDKYLGKAIVHHDISDEHKTAIGLEYQHLELGYPGLVSSELDHGYSSSISGAMPRWSTNMMSVLGEYQWTINDQFTLFSGARLDDHTYSSNMFSPRSSLIYAMDDRNTMKFMWSRSLRASFEEEMKVQAMSGNSDTAPERMENFELRYERIYDKNLWFGASGFVYSLDQIGVTSANSNEVRVGLLGEQKCYGGELEVNYQNEKWKLGISHGYTKLYSFDLYEGRSTIVTAAPYGYGDDLARWANNVTKFNARYKLNDQWSLNGSVRVYWGFYGLEDYVDYMRETRSDGYLMGSPDWKAAYRPNCYLNLGATYSPAPNLDIQFNGYNLLGFIDPDYNKRNYGAGEAAGYRNEAAAFGTTITYAF